MLIVTPVVLRVVVSVYAAVIEVRVVVERPMERTIPAIAIVTTIKIDLPVGSGHRSVEPLGRR